jgi:hypothetical protein
MHWRNGKLDFFCVCVCVCVCVLVHTCEKNACNHCYMIISFGEAR